MRIRSALILAALALGIAVPQAATTHTVRKACHGRDRVITVHRVGAGTPAAQTLYVDDRGFFSYADTPNEVDDQLPREARIPGISRSEGTDNSGTWLYLETNGHAGLQTGGDHAVLGETGESTGSSDPCVATHRKSRRTRATWGYDAILF